MICGCANIKRREIIHFQPFVIKLQLQKNYEVRTLIISSCLTLNFEKSSVWQKIILLSALLIFLISAPCFVVRVISL